MAHDLTVVATPPATSKLSTRQRDFMLLNIFVLAQHGYIGRAHALAEALYVLGDQSAEVILARAVLQFSSNDFAGTLTCLEALDLTDPIERFGSYTLTETERMRRYLKARCFHQLNEHVRARDVVDSYLRHGVETADGRE